MGLWAGIKHALNSTLGTEDFMPLDKLIKGQRTLAASDDIIAVIFSSSSDTLINKKTFDLSFTPKTNGVIRLHLDAFSTSTSNLAILQVNGKSSFSIPATSANRNNAFDLAVGKGVKYTFSVSGGAYVRKLAIGANIVDGSLFEINEVI